MAELYDLIEQSVESGFMKVNPLKEKGFVPGVVFVAIHKARCLVVGILLAIVSICIVGHVYCIINHFEGGNVAHLVLRTLEVGHMAGGDLCCEGIAFFDGLLAAVCFDDGGGTCDGLAGGINQFPIGGKVGGESQTPQT